MVHSLNADKPVLDNSARKYSDIFNFSTELSYNPRNNYLLSQLCGLVYDNDKDNKRIFAQVQTWQNHDKNLKVEVVDVEQSLKCIDPLEFESDHFFEKTSRFLVLYNNDFIILVFRGSSNIMDWYKDIQRSTTPFKEGKGLVHKGFYGTVKNMQRKIDETIKPIKGNQRIYITGHSLGGAQALLAAFVCVSLTQATSITTFGQPRVGDKTFMNWINPKLEGNSKMNESRYYRVVNKKDPVVHLPYFSYYHDGKFYINCSKNKLYNIVTGAKVKADLPGYMLTTMDENIDEDTVIQLGLPFIKNHYMDLYLQNAERNQDEDPF